MSKWYVVSTVSGRIFIYTKRPTSRYPRYFKSWKKAHKYLIESYEQIKDDFESKYLFYTRELDRIRRTSEFID